MIDAEVTLPLGGENGWRPACTLCVRKVEAVDRFVRKCPPFSGCSTFLLRMAA
jgi:hypothetical protein